MKGRPGSRDDTAGLRIEAYGSERAAEWNDFVASSRNGTFLFDRRFMDYHADRFHDASLLIRSRGRLRALLPAHRDGDDLLSHRGLTYGGLVVDAAAGAADVKQMVEGVIRHCAEAGVRRLLYKTVPPFYHRLPAEDDRYALFRVGATLVARELLSAIPPGVAAPLSQLRKRMLKRSAGGDSPVTWDNCWDEYWSLLERVLLERHAQRPVHTLAEIQWLAGRFPDNIHLRVARHRGEVAAGMVLFVTHTAVHVQYMAASEASRKLGLLDRLVDEAMRDAQASGRWFDFGISTEAGGRRLNEGLARWKEGFGARTVVHDTYELQIANAMQKLGG